MGKEERRTESQIEVWLPYLIYLLLISRGDTAGTNFGDIDYFLFISLLSI